MHKLDKIIDRTHQFSAKYDEMITKFGRSDLSALWVADMDFEVAEGISQAIEKRSKEKIYGYTSRPSEYHEAMINWYTERHNWQIKAEHLIHSPGVVTSLNVVVNTFTKPGDGIIIQTPVYFPFYEAVTLNKRQLLECPLIQTDGKFVIDYEILETLAQKAKLLILCNPHNPVGRVWHETELKKIHEICTRHGVRILSDEIHGDLTFEGHPYTPMSKISQGLEDSTITLLSATKTFNIPGLQASFIVAPNPEDYDAINQFFTIYDLKRNNCFSLVAVEAAYRTGAPWLESMLAYVHENMKFVVEFCKACIPECIPNMPEGTYLQWMDCTALGLSDEDLNQFMIHEAKIALNIGTAFGPNGTGFVRLNLACPKSQVETAMLNLEAAVNKKKMEISL